MGKLTEYLKLIPAGIKNIDKIIEGHINNVKLEHGTLAPELQEIIIKRRLICQTCPFNSTNAVKLGFYKNLLGYEHCTHCGCHITAKTASLKEDCGIAKYNENNPNTPLPLKWTKEE